MKDSTTSLRAAFDQAVATIQKLKARIAALEQGAREPIAIVGIGCRFPGANDPESFWELLREGKDAIREVPGERWDVAAYYDRDREAPGKMCTRWGGFLDEVDRFEPGFFGISPREAELLDPQQRLLLEVSWEALEDAGIAPDTLEGSRTGVFVGICSEDYAARATASGVLDVYSGTGNDSSLAVGRVAYTLGLEGPALAVNAACTSSLVAVHQACRSLRDGECETALAGGVNVVLEPLWTVYFTKLGLLSSEGKCKAFDASGDGFVRSDGCGVVVLKRLSKAKADGDRVLAVIRGSAVNQNGRSSGLTAPNGPAQEAVIRSALRQAGTASAEIDYVECQALGSDLADTIEANALGQVLREGRPPDARVLLGSVKTNIGHSEGAAGIAGLLKTVLALRNEEIPASLHCRTPNPHIPWSELPVAVATTRTPWRRGAKPRVAGVSAFGLSGANAHAIVAEAPLEQRPLEASKRPAHVLTLSARSAEALSRQVERYARHLARHPELALEDVCHTASTGRTHFEHRLALVATSREGLVADLEALARGETPPACLRGEARSVPKVAWVFGDRPPDSAGRVLYETQPVFRKALDRCADLVAKKTGRKLVDEMPKGPPADEVALFALEHALGELWRSFGAKLDGVTGEGTGKIVAACRAARLSLEDAIDAVLARGRSELSPGASVAELAERGVSIFLEIGRGTRPALPAGAAWLSSLERDEWSSIVRTLAELYVRGARIDWKAFDAPYAPRRVSLPTYPFQRERYWIERADSPATPESLAVPDDRPSQEDVARIVAKLEELAASTRARRDVEKQRAAQDLVLAYLRLQLGAILKIPVAKIEVDRPLIELGLDSLMATRIRNRVRSDLQIDLLPPREAFDRETTLSQLARVALERGTSPGSPPADLELAFPILPLDRSQELPLSFSQERLWFIDQLEPGSAVYNVPAAFRLKGALDVPALRRAFQEIMRRHEVLRTKFPEKDGRPAQAVADHVDVPVEVEDLSGLAADKREDDARRRASAFGARPFDLALGPLLRVELLRLTEDEHVLVICQHHIVTDGWSVWVLARELAELYGAFSTGREPKLPALPIQYADYAVWQRWTLGEGVVREHVEFWKKILAGAPAVLELPTDRPRPAVMRHEGAHLSFDISKDLLQRVKELAAREGATLFMTLLAAFKALLARYSGQQKIVVGSPHANRDRAEVEGLIGFFVNTLPIATDVSGDPSFRELLRRVREVSLQCFAHKEVPFERLVEELNPPRSQAHSPLFQVLFVLQESARGARAIDLPGLRLQRVNVDAGTAMFDLSLSMWEREGGGLSAWIGYDSDLFDRSTVERLTGHFTTLLETAVAGPEKRLSDLPLLTERERRQILVEWNDTKKDFPRDFCLHELVEEQGERTPDAVAAVFDGEGITYRVLNARANQLAHRLTKLGVEPDALVAICVERSVEMVVGLLGIVKAGGAYVPIDPEYPRDRIAFMLEDVRPAVLLTQERLVATLPPHEACVLPLDGHELEGESERDPGVRPRPSGLAYGIFTSGSTGKPKCALNTHEGIVNRLVWMQSEYKLTPGDCVLQKTPFSFDVSVWEFFWPLMTGARLVFAQPGGHRDPAYLVRLIAEEGVTRLHFVPSMLQIFLEESTLERRSAIQSVFCSGEALPREVQARFFDRLASELHNLYGPTEAAVDVTYWACDPECAETSVPIGRPVANTQMHVLDKCFGPVPIGVSGEIYIGGIQLARGYLNRPALTSERFVANPMGSVDASRLYRTGDLGRYRSDGAIEYLGRIDHQVKIRGFRIELGEVEAVLCEQPAVREAVVIARADTPGDKQLVAYLVPRGTAPAIDDLRAALKNKLPDYMVPSAFVVLDKLPLNPNGKVDRKALPAPEAPVGGATLEPPQTPTEETLAGIWGDVLRVEQVGRGASFFDLGGHSLLAIQVVSRIRKSFGVEFPVRDVFETPVLSDMARRVEVALKGGETDTAPLLVRVDREHDLPLSFAQERLWFLDQLEPGSALYSMPAAIRLTGPLDTAALERTIQEILCRHEALRTTFSVVEGKPVQVIREADLHLDVVPVATEEEARRLAEEDARSPFDLAQGPLFRARLLRISQGEHVLLLNTHHVASDGWSFTIFFREITTLYDAFRQGKPSPLPELAIQYADFAVWQRSWLQGEVMARQLAYWRKQLEGAPAMLELPTDRPRPPVQTHRGGRVPLAIPKELSEKVHALCRREGATPFMVLLAAFDALLGRYSGQEKVVVGTPIANRTRVEIEPLIGFFVNTLAVATDLSGDPSFEGLMRRVCGTALSTFVHQDLPFEKIVEELQPQRSMSHSPIFQVMFVLEMHQGGARGFGLEGLTVERVATESELAKFDLALSLSEGEERFEGSLEYSADLFDRSTIERLAGHFTTLLGAAVAKPGTRISDLPLLTERERRQILVEWNDTTRDFPRDRCVHELVEEQVERTPDAVAVTFEGERITYHELNRRANQLAHRLIALGVGPDDMVGICVERSFELVIGALAILKAGGGHLPLDPEYPRDRLEYVLEDARPRVLLTQRRLGSLLPEHAGPTIHLDADWGSLAEESADDPLVRTASDNLCFIIYTSGSTGRPKGTLNTHRGTANHLLYLQQTTPLTTEDTFVQKSPIGFDWSVAEYFWPLSAGARLVVVQPGGHRDPAYLVRLFGEERITGSNFVPSMLQAFLTEDGVDRACATLRLVFSGGEALSGDLHDRFLAWFGGELWNVCGPTECAVYTLAWRCSLQTTLSTIPIGRTITNTEAYVLDHHLRPSPIGVASELFIGGVCVGRGYLARPSITAERFVPSPYSGSGARLYRTGDRARFGPTGEVHYLGRLDFQVKIRGQRLELGEIEAAILAHGSLREAVVVAREDTPGNKQLVAYLVPRDGAPTIDDLRAALKKKLPDYMVPSAFVVLDKLPLNPNGKVDRKALPKPDGSLGRAGKIDPPADALELEVLSIFEDVLGVRPIGAGDDFFDLGGHSLLAVQLIARLRARYDRDLPLSIVFGGGSVRHVAGVLRQKTWHTPHLICLREKGSKPPLVLVHSISAEVFSFRPLAVALGPEQPVYALRALGTEPSEEPIDEMASLAGKYLEAIEPLLAGGPILLAGHSLGGVIAYEMARQLASSDRSVAFLGLFDSFLSPSEVPQGIRDTAALHMLLELGPDERLEPWRGVLSRDERVDRWLDLARKRVERSGRSFLAQLLRNETRGGAAPAYVRTCLALQDAWTSYRAQRYDGPVHLFRARSRATGYRDPGLELRETTLSHEDAARDPAPEWQSIAPRLAIHDVAGTHITMLRDPEVKDLATTLATTIQRIAPDSETRQFKPQASGRGLDRLDRDLY